MPKKKKINYEEPIPKRPHRKMKAKIVFDPSDTHIPKKRNKYSYTTKKPIEASNVKKTTNDCRKQQDTIRSKSPSVNLVTGVTELFGCMSTEINTISQIHSPIQFQGKRVTPKVTLDALKNCFICSTILGKTELIDCPICLTKVHKHCLIVSEPIWKFKLDLGHWFCKQCRKQNCYKCLKNESQSEILRRCITCEVGLHINCYESYDIKPLHKLETNMYVCIPCMTLATQVNPEEEDVVEAGQLDSDDDVKSHSSSIMTLSSDKDDTDSESNRSDSSSEYNKNDELKIPNISKWTKQQVFEYLSERLPKEIADQIAKFDNVLAWPIYSNIRETLDISETNQSTENDKVTAWLKNSFLHTSDLFEVNRSSENDKVTAWPDNSLRTSDIFEVDQSSKNELDGQALLLLQRTDIVYNMGMKLGHALNFYKQVRILQSQSTFYRIFWE